MFKPLLYKEWIKLRNIWLLLLAAHTLFALYLLFRLYTGFRLNDPVTIWTGWIFNGHLYYARYAYIPALTGILLAGAQFFPEVQNKRIRLVLHLPMNENSSILLHLVVGLLLYGLILLPAMTIFAAGAFIYFPSEYLLTAASQTWPWVLAGAAAYLLFAAILLEMLWRYRVVYLLFFLAMIQVYFLDGFYGAYRSLNLLLPAVTASLVLLPLLAAYRFRKGLTI